MEEIPALKFMAFVASSSVDSVITNSSSYAVAVGGSRTRSPVGWRAAGVLP